MKKQTKETTPNKVVKPVIASANMLEAVHNELKLARKNHQLKKEAFIAAENLLNAAEDAFKQATAVNEGILRSMR